MTALGSYQFVEEKAGVYAVPPPNTLGRLFNHRISQLPESVHRFPEVNRPFPAAEVNFTIFPPDHALDAQNGVRVLPLEVQ